MRTEGKNIFPDEEIKIYVPGMGGITPQPAGDIPEGEDVRIYTSSGGRSTIS